MNVNAQFNSNAQFNGNAQFNVDPSVWGPHMWATIHTLALKADSDAEVGPYLEFINSLLFLLPCDSCRADFTKWYSIHGDPLLGQAFEWSVKLHNYVNAKLNKPVVTEIQARTQWNSDLCQYSCTGATNSNSSSNVQSSVQSTVHWTSAVVIFAVLVTIVLLWRKKH